MLRSPEGQEHEHVGCYLEVVAPTRLVWTTALEPGFRPSSSPDTPGVPHFTAVISIEAHGTGTRYTAMAMHRDEAGCWAHDAMGFHEGWGAALTQLVEVAKGLSRRTGGAT